MPLWNTIQTIAKYTGKTSYWTGGVALKQLQSYTRPTKLFGVMGFLPGILPKVALPLAMTGAWIGTNAVQNLVQGGYDMNSPRAQWGYQAGYAEQYTNTPMSFSATNYSPFQMSANGSLAFSLSNRRKG